MKMHSKSNATKMSRGVFWIINDEFLAFPFTDEYSEGIAKSGNTYNHKKLWNEIKPKGCNKPYNYYPRGRVEISNKGKPIIYMDPNVDDSFIPLIRTEFGLRESPTIRYDTSQHYKCYLDDGWKSE